VIASHWQIILSLPELTRQSSILRKIMDHRVKPGDDTEIDGRGLLT